MRVQESYTPQPLAANATFRIAGRNLSGFLAVTSGTLTVTDGNARVLINAVPVSAGVYTPFPLMWDGLLNGTVVLAGGASGTLFV